MRKEKNLTDTEKQDIWQQAIKTFGDTPTTRLSEHVADVENAYIQLFGDFDLCSTTVISTDSGSASSQPPFLPVRNTETIEE